MAKRDFKQWLSTMKDSIATWTYYTDFEKVYENIQKVKVELNILNSLIGSKNIEEEFKTLISQYPNVLKAVPILLAKREAEIKVQDTSGSYSFNFINMNYTADQYVLFMRNSGLFDLLQNHIINNLVDYVLGIEVGMDTNGRKNRTGHLMEDLVESFLIKAGLVKGKTYFKEMKSSKLQKHFGIDLSRINNQGKVIKKFDFVFTNNLGIVFACECNFYSANGSKPSETARSYKELAQESKGIPNFQFVWFTDGKNCWDTSARNNLEETFDVLENLFNLADLENDVLKTLVDPTEYLKRLLNR